MENFSETKAPIHDPEDRVKALIQQSSDPRINPQRILKAFQIAQQGHAGQKRHSGEPYILHPIAVAESLAAKRMDEDSIITALLHDVVEDTSVKIQHIEKTFGADVARMVGGVTKLGQLRNYSSEKRQAENFRKLIIATARDLRVLLVKLADRRHNMQTIQHLPLPEKRLRISRETLEIYAPLAQRLGVHDWMQDMEDHAFNQINPDARASIMARIDFIQNQAKMMSGSTSIQNAFTNLLQKHNIEASVSGRIKTPYSIWAKMQKKHIGLEQITDILAFRVIVEDVPACYMALGILHQQFQNVPGRLKDYISLPKINGYQSIHTVVIGPHQERIELQIRSKDMHETAEIGAAAHWAYKAHAPIAEPSNYRWLRQILDILENASGVDEFLEHTKIEMSGEQVFVFSPKGEVYDLPKGATPIDFAYAVHTDIGDHCAGARINARIAPLRTTLQNGDQVEIITNPNTQPNPTWTYIAKSSKARVRIARALRIQKRDQMLDLGKTRFEQILRAHNQPWDDEAIKAYCSQSQYTTTEDLFAAIGASMISPHKIIHAMYPNLKPFQKQRHPSVIKRLFQSEKPQPKMKIRGLIDNMVISFAKCCFPIPGENICAIITTGKGVTIHTTDCRELDKFADMPQRWIDVEWESQQDHLFVARILAVIFNRPGSLNDVTTAIFQAGGNIMDVKFNNRHADFHEVFIDIEVKGLEHINKIIAGLKNVKSVHSCRRQKA